VTSAPINVEPLPSAGAPHSAQQEKRRRYLTAIAFVAPAAFFLLVWTVYPTIYTIARSLFGVDGFQKFVGIDNYKTLFSDHIIRTAIKNNFIWIVVVPFSVTMIGLIFAVLTERIRWATVFKVVVFAPLAISLFATGVMWRVMYQKDPSQGAINAAIRAVSNTVSSPGVLTGAQGSSPKLVPAHGGIQLRQTVRSGGTALLGLTAIPATDVPAGAKQAVKPPQKPGTITGTVWRDFKPGGGKPGVVEQGETGLPGVTVVLRDASDKQVQSTKTNPDGSFTFDHVSSGSYHVAIAKSTFAAGFGGISWLGPSLITLAMILAYLWAQAGFAMVVIAAGLASIPRDTLEAARTDGATEFQVFRRVTVPLLAPVLTVVFVTQIIGILKLFDIVYSIAPGSSVNSATLLAYEMYRRSFLQNDFGLGSAIATFLLVLVVPILVFRIRDFRREVQ
jgi:alpha-glucoside transport system permease protein